MSTRTEREEQVRSLEERFRDSTGIYLTGYKGINVERMTGLRADFRENDCGYVVVKNTLAGLALQRSGRDGAAEHLTGQVGIAFTRGDATAPAKVIKRFQDENKGLLTVKVAYVEGALVDGDKVKSLAALPSRDVLLAQLLSCMNAPVANLASALNRILGSVVGAIDAVRRKKEGE
jgi:ribosomal protein L10